MPKPPRKTSPAVHAKFEKQQCPMEDRETVESYLKHLGLVTRFKKEARKVLGQLVFNLSKGGSFAFCVGAGRTPRQRIKNAMVQAELMEWKAGYNFPQGGRAASVATPTALLNTVLLPGCQIKRPENAKKRSSPYWEDPKTLQNVSRFNQKITGYSFRLDGSDIDPRNKFYYLPKESGEITRARMINQVQVIKNKENNARSRIKIEGAQVARIDITATHPQLLLNKLRGAPMSIDPYDIRQGTSDAKEWRDRAKLMLMMCLNTRNKRAALSAFGCEWRKEHRSPGEAKKTFEALLARNPEIEPFFFSRRFVDLFNWEGTIFFNAQLMLLEKGIPTLSVHDELITRKEDVHACLEVLKECWVKETRFNGILKLKVDANRPEL